MGARSCNRFSNRWFVALETYLVDTCISPKADDPFTFGEIGPPFSFLGMHPQKSDCMRFYHAFMLFDY